MIVCVLVDTILLKFLGCRQDRHAHVTTRPIKVVETAKQTSCRSWQLAPRGWRIAQLRSSTTRTKKATQQRSKTVVCAMGLEDSHYGRRRRRRRRRRRLHSSGGGSEGSRQQDVSLESCRAQSRRRLGKGSLPLPKEWKDNAIRCIGTDYGNDAPAKLETRELFFTRHDSLWFLEQRVRELHDRAASEIKARCGDKDEMNSQDQNSTRCFTVVIPTRISTNDGDTLSSSSSPASSACSTSSSVAVPPAPPSAPIKTAVPPDWSGFWPSKQHRRTVHLDWRNHPREVLFPARRKPVEVDEGWGYFVDATPVSTPMHRHKSFRRLFPVQERVIT